MSAPERPSKQDAFLALLREGWTSLHLDARRPGVIVPAHLRGEAHLVLQYGHDLPISIPDLEVDEYGVRATLSFSRNPQLTVVPWSAIYVVACDDGRGVLYQEDVPEDVSIVAARPPSDRAPDADITHEEGHETIFDVEGRAAKRRDSTDRLLKAVPDDAVLDEPLDDPPRRRRPQLRLVK
ncbi:MAG TPA: ClpXP protease specificity-enhancing factor SspB [Polyangia bacterium]|jgi:stringent starvation protein B|nr:ClpXP protease specificity-enhancing factor SspB [Polyangia bacterium]